MFDDDEEEVFSEDEKLFRKKRDKELDNLLWVTKDLDGQEAEERIAKVTPKTKKTLFPPWSFERIQKEVIVDLSVLCLEPAVLYEQNNTANSQLDFPLTPKAFLFRGFEHIKKAPLSDNDVNNMLFSFYLKHSHPQYEIWSLEKLVVVKVYAPFPVEHFTNIKFKGFRGKSRVQFDFTLADLPFMNPND